MYLIMLDFQNIYMYEKTIPIGIDIMEIMKHTYIGNKI